MKRLLTLVAFFATLQASAQQVNPVPDYVFRNQMSVGRNAVTDTGAYFSIGPRYGAVKGFMPPIVSDTASVNANKRNGLLIFSVQKNKFLYWDSVRVQWSDMAGSSGSYITGKGITGYVPQFTDTATLDTSALYTLGNQLGIGTSSFAYTGSGRTVVELNGTSGGLYGFKRNDSAKGYLFHNGDNMELANTVAGSISFNTNSATRGSISSAGVWRLHNLAGTGDRVVVASSNGTLSAASSATGLVDTLTISTRAWRQKGDDSLGAIIATKGNGTVTSVATGYGLSGGTITTTGTLLVDTLNIATRAWRQKGLDSLAALEVSGSGTTNYVPKFTAGSTIGNSQIFDNGTNVGIGTASPTGFSDKIVNVYGATSAELHFTTAGTGTANSDGFVFSIRDSDGLAQIMHRESAALLFGTGDTEAGRINSSREWLLSSGGTDAGDYKLQVSGNIYNTGSAVLAATSGNVGVGTTTINAKLHVLSATGTAQSLGDWANNIAIIQGASRTGTTAVGGSFATTLSLQSNDDVITAGSGASVGFSAKWNSALYGSAAQFASIFGGKENGSDASLAGYLSFATRPAGGNPTERGRINSAGEWIIDASGTDAGDYKLQVVGNARVGTGKLDIASNTTFGIGVARSGTSEVAGQIYNSNGILYIGAESSAGGGIFSGSSAYAAVIGSGANYPLQFATNNATRATINTNGELLINTTTDAGDYKLQVSGNGYLKNGQVLLDSVANKSALFVSQHSVTGSASSNMIGSTATWNTTGNPALIDFSLTNTASGSDANYIKISDGTNTFRVTKAAEVVTAAPSGGSIKPWKLGEAATVSPTSPNRTIRVEIDGVVYYLHAKTTND